MIPTAWAIIFFSELTVLTIVGVATTEELLFVGINVGSEAEGGRVGVGRKELVDLVKKVKTFVLNAKKKPYSFAGMVILSDCRPNRVEAVVGMYVIVRREVCDCGRPMTDTDPSEESKIDESSLPSAERVRFTVALEEEIVVR